MRRLVSKLTTPRSLRGFFWGSSLENSDKIPKRSENKEEEGIPRLPSIPWRYDMEFKRPTRVEAYLQQIEFTRRVWAKTLQALTSPARIEIALSFSAVLGIGIAECALMVTNPGNHLGVLFSYGFANIIPSMIWETISLETIVNSLGLSSGEVLRAFTDCPEDVQAEAIMNFRTKLLSVIRSILASVMTLTQIIKMIQTGKESLENHKRFLDGRETPGHVGIHERFFRMGGTASDVTELSIERYGTHVLPVFSQDSNRRKVLAQEYSDDGHYPVLWTVSGNYANITDWEPLFKDIDGIWYLKTRSGQSVLYMEADATNIEEAMALGLPKNDLSPQEAFQSFRVLEMVANTKLRKPPDSIVRIFLADTFQQVELGGNKTIDLGSYIHQTKEADVIVDATAPLLEKVLEWCEKVEASEQAEKRSGEGGWFEMITARDNPEKTILFDTTNKDVYKVIGALLARYGYRIVDRGSVTPSESFDYPRLIYRDTSDDTVSLLHTLMTRRLASPEKCCILIDSSRVTTIRIWTRMGYKPHEIQSELKTRFSPIHNVILNSEILPGPELGKAKRKSKIETTREPDSSE
ncbi:hypothetical protein AAMO2058_000614400 [Amorphochlora amoebiformis]